MSADLEKLQERIDFLEEESRTSQIALKEILAFDSLFSEIDESMEFQELFEKTTSHLNAFMSFESVAFQMLNEERAFKMCFYSGEHEVEYLEKELHTHIEDRTYAWALHQRKTIVVPLGDGSGYMVFHALFSKAKVLGMFVGIHRENILETEQALPELLSVLLRRTGNYVALLQRCKRVYNEVKGLKCEIVEKNHALTNARKEAGSLEETQGNILCNVSHEFRTPVSAIIGLMSLMEDSESITDEHREYIQMATQSASCILGFIDDLLLHVQLKSSSLHLTPLPHNLKEAMRGLFADEWNNTPAASVTAELVLEENIHDLYLFDSKLLSDALRRLLDNALRFTPQGRVELRVSEVSGKNKVSYVTFLVSDTGIGFDESQKDYLMRAFTQVDQSHAREYEGMGMGLALTSLILETMGSELHCTSEIGKGSEFSFTLTLTRI
ncbi:MAG: sensor histidine kinase [Lentisphaeraceae bacterium]|nr:sensor histidine kinase [Lentisphaeraceae bacterium]